MHYTLYTTSKSQKMQAYADRFIAGLMKSPGREATTITIKYHVPKTVKTKKDEDGDMNVDWAWFSSHFQGEAGRGVAFHFTPTYRKRWGIKPTLNGAKNTDNKTYPEFWLCADVTAKAKGYKDLAEVERLLFHESGHFEEDRDDKVGNFLPQNSVHKIDYEDKSIHTYPQLIDFRRLGLLDILRRTLIAKIIELTSPKVPTSLLHPVDAFKGYVTYQYGVKDASYTRSGRHIGTDYGTPVGTPVCAPWDGVVTVGGFGVETGYYCHYRYNFKGQVFEEQWLHLRDLPKVGPYKRGQLVAYTGNTGRTTGPHLHHAVWCDKVDIAGINKTNWAVKTIDPQKHYL